MEGFISIIIPVSRPKAFYSFLKQLTKVAVGKYDAFEVIGVGNMELPATVSVPFQVNLISCDETHPNSRRNKGLAISRGSIIAFLDDDTEILPGWFKAAQGCPDNTVLTGPEIPMGEGARQLIIYQVCCFILSEGTKAHVNFNSEPVSWSDVPFCNMVVSRSCLSSHLPLSMEIPWDIDDFHLMKSMKSDVQFKNDANLRIKHDRYPNRFSNWFKYKWHQRMRLGEKAISEKSIYLKLPSVWVVLLAPYLVAVYVAFTSYFGVLSLALVYSGVLMAGVISQRSRMGSFSFMSALGFVYALFVLHGITVLAPQFGAYRLLLKSK